MLRLTLAQMRRSIGRLTAAGIAILIGTAFLTATLLASNVITRTSTDSIAAQFAQADLVLSAPGGVGDDDLDAARDTAGVDAAGPQLLRSVEMRSGSKQVYQIVVPTASDKRFEPQEVTEGAMPTASGEIALPEALAERFGVGLGDEITVERNIWTPDAGTEGEYVSRPQQLTVVGAVDDPFGAYAQVGGAAVVSPEDAAVWDADAAGPDAVEASYDAIVVALAPGADLETVRADLLTQLDDGAMAQTTAEYAKAQTSALTGDQDVFTNVVLGFAAIALLVAALVIANTFQVLIAQRTRTLALLRCVGADRKQLARSVLTEATLLGVVSSVAGFVVGAGLTQLALSIAGGMDLGVPLPTAIEVVPAAVLVPLIVGTLVTVVASFAPARAATRVAPLAALRPPDSPTLSTGAGKARLVTATILVVLGGGLLALGVVAGYAGQAEVGLLVGILGGAMSFVGVLVGAVFWLPRVVSVVGRAITGSGSTAKLAAANTLRNPRRTAATSTALLIGVTLVAMMSTGAASARTSMNAELDDHYPVDVSLTTNEFDELDGGGETPALPEATLAQAENTAGVGQVVRLTGAVVTVDGAGDPTSGITLRGVDAAQAADVARSPGLVEGLAADTVIVPKLAADSLGIVAGDSVTITGPSGTEKTLTAVRTTLPGQALLVTTETMDQVAPNAPVTRAWVGLTDVNDAATVVPALQDTIAESSVPVEVVGAAVERASYQKVIDTILAVIIGLLAVAVVIALIGVANTLSLSVIERRRESATLRAIGLSRSQLRWMLAIEGMLIAGVGALLGVVLGVLYGWAGSSTALAVMGDVTLAVPWRDVAVVLVVAVVAGLLASVIPGRSAARTSPVEALAVD